MVKFAKEKPDDYENEQSIVSAIEFVQNTTALTQSESETEKENA